MTERQRQPAHVRSIDGMVHRDELLDSKRFCEAMRYDSAELSNAVRANRVFYVTVRGECMWPSFFTDLTLERQQLHSVIRQLADLPGEVKLGFMTQPKASLGGLTPLESLRAREFSKVMASAAAFAER